MIRLLLPLALLSGADAPPAPGPPALVVRLVRPDRQLARFLDLFEGAEAGVPAKALADWKRAKAGRGFSKAAEAGFAFLNPEMVRELRALDDLRVFLRPSVGGAGGWEWGVALPGDDGTFDAVATALALTDGARVEDLDGRPVDRLGPAGAPLMTTAPHGRGALLGSSREALREAADAGFLPDLAPPPDSGVFARLDAAALGRRGDLLARRTSEALLGAGLAAVEAEAALVGGTWELRLVAKGDAPPVFGATPIDPAWVAAVPDKDRLAAFALAVDPKPELWNKLFEWADRVEKADPSRAGVAPLRLRLAILTGGLGIRPEADLLPHLKGISGFVFAGPDLRGAATFHFKDGGRAKRFLEGTVLPLARSLKQGEPEAGADGLVAWPKGRLEAKAEGADLRIGWGNGILREASAAPKATPAALGLPGVPPQRFLSLRPAGFDPRFPPESALVWTGGAEGATTRDRIVVTGLKSLAVRTLERLLAGDGR